MRAQQLWLIGSMIALAVTVTACGDDDAATGDPETQAAMALSRAMRFTGGELRDGAMGLATEDRVELLLESEQVVHPGEAGLMPLEVDNPISDDNPGDAVLMQFADVDQHVRVPTNKSVDGPGDLNFEFMIDDSVCNGLCATTIDVPITLALELENGDIGKHEKTSIKVDCSKKGSKAACNNGTPSKGGKAGSSGASRDSGVDLPSSGNDGGVSISPGATAAVQDLLDAVDDLDSEVCSCIPSSDGSSCLDAVTAQRPCNEAVLEAYAEGNEDLLACTRDFFVDQTSCITDAACDSTKLEACTASTSMSSDWTAIEAACGTVPAGLRNGIDACGGQTSPSPSSCLDGTAIDSSDFCDGVEDCPDGSDEAGCSPGNPGNPGKPTSFPCGSSTIGLDKVCDGTMDCPGGLDEMVCVACTDNSGMYSSFDLCDGEKKCADGSDEANCDYPCVGGGTVNVFLVCNGTPDCPDGSDESFCNGSNFTCQDGAQVPIMSVCNGTADCSDGSDETQALCGSM